MFAVIFTASEGEKDAGYEAMSERMRKIAFEDYGCKDFISVNEDGVSISISYWGSMMELKAWKEDVEHLEAQAMGREKWYQNYKVQVVEVLREYDMPRSEDGNG